MSTTETAPKTTAVPARLVQAPTRDLAAVWLRGTPAERLKALLDHPRAEEIIAAMPAEDLFVLVKDVGLESATALLPFATVEQWRTFVDLDGWQRDDPDVQRLVEWFEAAQEAGPDVAQRMLAAADEEYLTSVLQEVAVVHERDLDPNTVPDNRELFQSPDGQFYIEMPRGHALVPFVMRALKFLFAHDLLRGRRILRACLHELHLPLVEQAYQFRRARLADLGLPPFEEAGEMFRRAPVARFRKTLLERLERARGISPQASAEGPRSTGLVLPRNLDEGLFAARVLADLDDPDLLGEIGQQFILAGNRVAVVMGWDIREPDNRREGVRLAMATASIGLEYLAAGDEALARRIAQTVWVVDLFRTGFTLIDRLRNRAVRIARRLGGREGLSLLDEPLDAALEALLRRFPEYYEGIEPEGRPIAVTFQTLAQVRRMRAVVSEAEAVLDWFEEVFGLTPQSLARTPLPGLPEDERLHVRLSTLWLTALANRLVLGRWSLEPLGPAVLDQFVAAVLPARADGPRVVAPALRERAIEAIRVSTASPQRRAALVRFVERALSRLEEVLGGLPPGESPDPRYLGSVLLARHDDTA